jgi:organic radical activating enzyme
MTIKQRPFPIKTETACQLKWSHSTVFLTQNRSSSCHRVQGNQIDESFDFHNTPDKISDREKMLKGEWPGRGCEHCKDIEDAGGTSDRMLHLNFPGLGAPPEVLDGDLTATKVAPRWLEIYFSNLCNLSCLYCGEHFSSSWESENKKFGHIDEAMGREAPNTNYTQNYKDLNSKMFDWLNENVHHLYNLMILGGEPFTQPQSDQLLDFLEARHNPNLTLTFFSNLSVDHERMKKRFNRMQKLKDNGHLAEIHIFGSIDCWCPEIEYIRSGLDLELFEKNFEYLVNETDVRLGVNAAWMSLSTFTMPDLIKKINKWSTHQRPVFFSLMQAAGQRYVHPEIFGPKVLDWGYREAVELFETQGNNVKEGYKTYLEGILKKIENSEPDIEAQRQFHKYLTVLDDRRNTDYRTLFPAVYTEIQKTLQINSEPHG